MFEIHFLPLYDSITFEALLEPSGVETAMETITKVILSRWWFVCGLWGWWVMVVVVLLTMIGRWWWYYQHWRGFWNGKVVYLWIVAILLLMKVKGGSIYDGGKWLFEWQDNLFADYEEGVLMEARGIGGVVDSGRSCSCYC